MRKEDVTQVAKLDREAFPTQWPPTDYHHELQNRLAHYIVACEERETVEAPEVEAPREKSLSGLTSKVRQLFNHNCFFGNEMHQPSNEYIVGFAGIWIMADEAHIINIAVREDHRRQGIGELLLISIIDLATELNASIVTLEVRTSNTAAQSLYHKYGFSQVGIRRGYYTDNREDAILMSTEKIASTPFQIQLNRLKQAHSKRWGIPLYQIVR
ncbi:MAG: ribosomal protein S18-alanine N-acetyltransferase [Dehalococcoidales bacterium]|nr:ribosomal protein S18-alanine N-acetyltransferase [Dehalococcoidales bacterium]